MIALLYPTYFPSITQFAAMVQAGQVIFEKSGHYRKQTYMSRCHIATAMGKLALSVPVRHRGNLGRQLYSEALIENAFPWQDNHWKSIQTAYRSSPFFEFYEDGLVPLFSEKQERLFDLDIKCFETVCGLLSLDIKYGFTTEYERSPEDVTDLRELIDAKKPPGTALPPYNQVLADHHGFLPDLSILDLMFNEGPETVGYLLKTPKFTS